MTEVTNKKQAIEIVEKYLMIGEIDAYYLLSDSTLEHELGWLIFYTTIEYHRSGEFRDIPLGIGPILVRRMDGKMIQFGSAFSGEKFLEQYSQHLKGIELDVPKLWEELTCRNFQDEFEKRIEEEGVDREILIEALKKHSGHSS